MSNSGSSYSLLSSLFHGSRSSSTVTPYTSAHPLLRDFENRLSSQMEKLLQSEQRHCSYLNAKWLCQALDVCLSAHSHAEEVLFPQILTEGRKWEPSSMDWVNQQLEDTVKLLDVCNVVRESIWKMKEYARSLHLAIHCLDGNGCNFISPCQLVRARNALSRCLETMSKKETDRNVQRSKLEKCSSMLRKMGELKPGRNSAKGQNNNSNNNDNIVEEIMCGCKVATVLVCSALVAALSSKSKRSTWLVCSVDRWGRCPSLLSVQQKVKEEVEGRRRTKGAGALLEELDSVDTAVRGLYDVVNGFIGCKSILLGNDQRVQLKQSVQILEKSTVELDEGLGILEKLINQVFNALVSRRMALLDILSYS